MSTPAVIADRLAARARRNAIGFALILTGSTALAGCAEHLQAAWVSAWDNWLGGSILAGIALAGIVGAFRPRRAPAADPHQAAHGDASMLGREERL